MYKLAKVNKNSYLGEPTYLLKIVLKTRSNYKLKVGFNLTELSNAKEQIIRAGQREVFSEEYRREQNSAFFLLVVAHSQSCFVNFL